ncbi:MAG TPA: HAD family hydrolase [Thermoanaerobaculia bacterium]
MIKAIAFDLWETLITNTPDVSREHHRLRIERMKRILGEGGFAATTERIESAYREVWQRCHELYWSADKDISCRTQIDHFLEVMEVKPFDERTIQALEDAYANVAVEVLPLLVPGAAEIVAEVKGRGYSLGLISNTGRTPGYALRTILDRLNLSQFFDAMVFSNEHGECKPQRSIFETLRQSLDVEFEEMLFVGDNLYVDVHGAQQCGMIGVHFLPPTRGDAVAPVPDHDLTIEPHATIHDLRELPQALDALSVDLSLPRARLPRG